MRIRKLGASLFLLILLAACEEEHYAAVRSAIAEYGEEGARVELMRAAEQGGGRDRLIMYSYLHSVTPIASPDYPKVEQEKLRLLSCSAIEGYSPAWGRIFYELSGIDSAEARNSLSCLKDSSYPRMSKKRNKQLWMDCGGPAVFPACDLPIKKS